VRFLHAALSQFLRAPKGGGFLARFLMTNLYCWEWARGSTWRSVRVYAYAGAWGAEAWYRDLTTGKDRTLATASGATVEAAVLTPAR
jgi:hypothetical protein